MSNKMDIEEDIKILNIMINSSNNIMSDLREDEVKALRNILKDRERLQLKANAYDSLVKEIQNKITAEKEEIKYFAKIGNDEVVYRHAYAKDVLEELQLL